MHWRASGILQSGIADILIKAMIKKSIDFIKKNFAVWKTPIQVTIKVPVITWTVRKIPSNAEDQMSFLFQTNTRDKIYSINNENLILYDIG